MLVRTTPSRLAAAIVLSLATVVLLAPLLVSFLVPAAAALRHGAPPLPSATTFFRTVSSCAIIGMLATLFAWLPARVISSSRGRWMRSLCLVPLLMPPYLAFAGYSILRDPSSPTGSLLESLAANGHPWVTIEVGRSFAFLGLALWSWPVAALILAAGMHGSSIDDALRLDAPRCKQTLQRIRLNRSSLLTAFASVVLINLGSAIPLHLAQIDTIAIDAWRRMNESAPETWGAIWLASWPIVLAALLAAISAPKLIERLMHSDLHAPEPVRVGRPPRVVAWVVWAAATLLPFLFFLASIHSVHSLKEFWRLSTRGVVNGLATATATCAITAVIALLSSYLLDRPRRRPGPLVGLMLAAWTFVALVPGVFVGAALARWGTHLPRSFGDALVVNAHVARFACFPLLAAVAATLADPPDLCDLHVLEAGSRLRAWVAAFLPRRLPVLAAAAASGIMGFHEIEATTMLLPPGRDNLAQQILGYLHFSRMEEMSAASAYLIGGGFLGAVLVSTLIVRQRPGS